MTPLDESSDDDKSTRFAFSCKPNTVDMLFDKIKFGSDDIPSARTQRVRFPAAKAAAMFIGRVTGPQGEGM